MEKKLHEYISEQEITYTIKTGNTRKNFAAEISLLQEQKRKSKKGFVFCIINSDSQIKNIIFEALTTTNETLDLFFHKIRDIYICDNEHFLCMLW